MTHHTAASYAARKARVKSVSTTHDTANGVWLFLRGLSVSQVSAGGLLHLTLLVRHSHSFLPVLIASLIIPLLLPITAGVLWRPLQMNRAAIAASCLLSVLLFMATACSLLHMSGFALLCQPFVPFLLIVFWITMSASIAGAQEKSQP